MNLWEFAECKHLTLCVCYVI